MSKQTTIIELRHVTKLYGLEKDRASQMLSHGVDKATVQAKTGVTVALWDVNLAIPEGRVSVIIGLSGSGKSTLVRMLNKLNKPTSGEVLFQGKNIARYSQKELLDYRRRNISMVFQSFGLMENRDVLGNVAYGLEVQGMEKSKREQKAMDVIAMVGRAYHDKRKVKDYSLGMRQRVGIARALATDSPVLLMDEPFSALDPLVRQDMQFELLHIQRKLQKTVVFITHDMDEAFKLGDMVAIMKDGRIVQTDTPEGMSLHPVDEYVRAFTDNADKTKVVTVRNIMIVPSVLVKTSDGVEHAIHVMMRHALSSAYVVDDDLRLAGIIDIRSAIAARKEGKGISDIMDSSVHTVTGDDLIADIVPLSAESPYPLAVVDGEGGLEGIVTKASVLASLR